MNRKIVIEAAAVLRLLEGVKALRATIHGGKHELRLYALTEKETMEDEIGVDPAIAKSVLARIIDTLEKRLTDLGIDRQKPSMTTTSTAVCEHPAARPAPYWGGGCRHDAMRLRKEPQSQQVDLPWRFVDLAQRRTEFLFRHLTYGDMPLRTAMASAWLQGASDAADALDHQRTRERIAVGAGMHTDQSCTGES